jgi:transcriptional regulator with XRE-family HTH domain
MSPRISTTQLGNRIKEIRVRKGLSQNDLAKLLEMPRSSVAQMELGNRNVSVIELVSLSEILGFSIDKFLGAEYVAEENISLVEDPAPAILIPRDSTPKFKAAAFKNIILYILERCAGKPNIEETALGKLLYFCDFDHYEKYEEQLTGASYRKHCFGPVPQNQDIFLAKMLDSGQLFRLKTVYQGFPHIRFIPLVKPDLTQMRAVEKETIDQAIDRFSEWPAVRLRDYSRLDLPWKATDEGEIINYELAFYREPPYSVRTYSGESGVL